MSTIRHIESKEYDMATFKTIASYTVYSNGNYERQENIAVAPDGEYFLVTDICEQAYDELQHMTREDAYAFICANMQPLTDSELELVREHFGDLFEVVR
jgi:hypothetical protein